MTACKLDKSKSYGLILGATDGSMYDQDGIVFDVNGNPLNQKPEDAPQEQPKKRGRPAKEHNDLAQ